MARQSRDDARHAALLLRRIEELSGYEGEYGFCHCIWRAPACAETCAEQLAIQQIVGKGNGMDVATIAIALSQSAGDHQTAETLKFQNMNEALHCRFGNRWLLSRLSGDTVRDRELVVCAAGEIDRALPGAAPLAMKMRARTRFPYEFVAFFASHAIRS